MNRIKFLSHPLLRHSSIRFMLSILVGVAAVVITDLRFGWALSIVVGWDAGALIMLLISWGVILHSTAVETKERAAAEDPGRTVVFLLVSFGSAISLFASAYVLRHVKQIDPADAFFLSAACLAAVTLSWALTHTAFTFRYARMYYENSADGSHVNGGLIFPGGEAPDDFDFAYFSFVLGMAFQTSDICISSAIMRRTALLHSLLAFAYNTTLVAFTLNIFFGIIS